MTELYIESVNLYKVSVYIYGSDTIVPGFGIESTFGGWNGEAGENCERRQVFAVQPGEWGAAAKRLARRMKRGVATRADHERLMRASGFYYEKCRERGVAMGSPDLSRGG